MNNNINTTNEKKDKFITEIKVNNKKKINIVQKGIFLKEIEETTEKLNMLSIDRLKKLEEYYDNVIDENNEKIEKLKTTV